MTDVLDIKCHHCGKGMDECECAVMCDFCQSYAWRDEVERVDHLFLNHFYRCLDCAPRRPIPREHDDG